MTVTMAAPPFVKVACPCGRVNAEAAPGSVVRLRCVRCGSVFVAQVREN